MATIQLLCAIIAVHMVFTTVNTLKHLGTIIGSQHWPLDNQ